MKKRLLTFSLTALLIASIASACFADSTQVTITEEQSKTLIEFEEVITDTVSRNTSTPRAGSVTNDTPILFHNNGQPLTADYILSENPEDYLVAIYRSKIGGANYETAYFSTNTALEKESLINRVRTNESEFLINESSALEDAISNYSTNSIESLRAEWEIDYGNGVEAEITSTTLYVKDPNSTHNLMPSTFWTLKTTNAYEKRNAIRLNSFQTTMNVNQTDQELLDYEPKNNYSGNNISGSIGYPGGIALDYEFTINGFEMESLGSFANKYGRWLHTANLGANSDYLFDSCIVAANTSGNFKMNISHIIDVTLSDYTIHSVGKGIQYNLTDR